MRCRAVVPALALAVLAVPAVASAGWSSSASGSAVAGADVMSNATGFSAACTQRSASSSITLRWTASPDPYVTGYSIVRTSSNGSTLTRTVSGRTTSSLTDTVSSPAGQTLTYTIQASATGTLWRTAPTTASGRPSYTGSKNVCLTL